MMNLDYYKIFYHVAVSKSFTGAAQILHNSQPNMMRYVNVLEAELGCKLFIRGRRGVTLTEEGEHLYRYVSGAMHLLEEGEREIRNMQLMSEGYIAIGASETSMRMVLLERLEAFNGLYPNVRINITNSSMPEALRALGEGVVNMAVITSPYTLPQDMDMVPVRSFREILICGPKFKAYAGKEISLKALEDLPFICMSAHTGTKALYQHFFMSHGVCFSPEMECATSDQILQMVLYNLGVGFYPEELVRKELESGRIFKINLKEEVPMRQVSVITSRHKDPGEAGRKLIKLMTGGACLKQ